MRLFGIGILCSINFKNSQKSCMAVKHAIGENKTQSFREKLLTQRVVKKKLLIYDGE